MRVWLPGPYWAEQAGRAEITQICARSACSCPEADPGPLFARAKIPAFCVPTADYESLLIARDRRFFLSGLNFPNMASSNEMVAPIMPPGMLRGPAHSGVMLLRLTKAKASKSSPARH